MTLAMSAALLGSPAPAWAMTHGTTDLGTPYVSGGVGTTEQATLKAEGKRYSVAILTATKGDGDYLADVRIHITDSASRLVLDIPMDGPWLLVELPAGTYEVKASRKDQVQTRRVSFAARAQAQAVFYFDNHREEQANAAEVAAQQP